MASQKIDIGDYVIDEEDEEVIDLDKFRRQWIEDLKQKSGVSSQSQQNREETADELYLSGMRSENEGNMEAAVTLYRRAIKKDGDVEDRILKQQRCKKPQPTQDLHKNEISKPANDSVEESLLTKFSGLNLTQSRCDDGVISLSTPALNITQLPTEILLLVVRHVISHHVDMRSLAAFALTCRRFYLVARDAGIWRDACKAVAISEEDIKSTCSSTSYHMYKQVMMSCCYPRMDGCYVSKITYFRQGDQSQNFSTHFSPFQQVVYYRYARFTTDGQLIMVTSSEKPVAVVPRMSSLRHVIDTQQAWAGKMAISARVGCYRCRRCHLGEPKTIVSATLRETIAKPLPGASAKRRRRRNAAELQYVMTSSDHEVELALGAGGRMAWKSQLCRYHMADGRSSESQLRVEHDQQHPPFRFLHVTSYHLTSCGAL